MRAAGAPAAGFLIGPESSSADQAETPPTRSRKQKRLKFQGLSLPGNGDKVREMITFLEGVLVEALPTQVVLDVNGVGYQVLIPVSSFDSLPAPGVRVRMLTHLAVREDAHILYGFASRDERDLFRLLINRVTGVGPKLALSVLSGMSVTMFQAAVVAGDITAISRISGVGKKTAERMVVELKDKVGVAAEWEAASARHAPGPQAAAASDAVLALISLGYKQIDAHKAVKTVADENPGAASDDLVRAALKRLA